MSVERIEPVAHKEALKLAKSDSALGLPGYVGRKD
ncbi:hypothetical protein QFZ99_007036 [Paraburkholderia atlantica]